MIDGPRTTPAATLLGALGALVGCSGGIHVDVVERAPVELDLRTLDAHVLPAGLSGSRSRRTTREDHSSGSIPMTV